MIFDQNFTGSPTRALKLITGEMNSMILDIQDLGRTRDDDGEISRNPYPEQRQAKSSSTIHLVSIDYDGIQRDKLV